MYYPTYQGLFITLEGGEGSGKSTMAKYLTEHLKKMGVETLCVREPGSSDLGERIRDILLSKREVKMCPMSELLLYLAARAQNLEENIKIGLEKRLVVICDRYNDSSIAYQAAARGLETHLVQKLCELVTGGLEPHLTLFLDVSPIVGRERAFKLKSSLDAMETEGLEFHNSVRSAYYELAAANSKRVVRLSAEIPLEKMLKEGLSLVYAALKQHSYFREILHKYEG